MSGLVIWWVPPHKAARCLESWSWTVVHSHPCTLHAGYTVGFCYSRCLAAEHGATRTQRCRAPSTWGSLFTLIVRGQGHGSVRRVAWELTHVQAVCHAARHIHTPAAYRRHDGRHRQHGAYGHGRPLTGRPRHFTGFYGPGRIAFDRIGCISSIHSHGTLRPRE